MWIIPAEMLLRFLQFTTLLLCIIGPMNRDIALLICIPMTFTYTFSLEFILRGK